MAFCRNCGASLDGNSRFCSSCGAKVDVETGSGAYDVSDAAGEYFKDDIEKNKLIAGFSYIIFFLPFIACPDSKFARFHANQAFVLIVAWLCINAAFWLVNLCTIFLLAIILVPIQFLLGLGLVALGIAGMVNGFSGNAKELPIIGKFKIFK